MRSKKTHKGTKEMIEMSVDKTKGQINKGKTEKGIERKSSWLLYRASMIPTLYGPTNAHVEFIKTN